MSKKLEDLLIEFDEMGYEPTILCDTEKEIESFRRRLKQVLDYLREVDNAKPSEALECLGNLERHFLNKWKQSYYLEEKPKELNDIITIKQALMIKSKKEKAFDEFNKYLTKLHRHRNHYKKIVLYDFEIDKAVIRASTIEEIYNKFKEVLGDE